ncbi:TonB-dependent receptor [Geomonas limicola]|uniref:TonB-dependent receptor n=1 Tax=Geomonas limicola TaxID=2740186 RepID=A0A6V8N1Y3_9BACT|nr:TonB-dependent receptor [Geomonas limicola]GFO66482.1 TonB-dependent receptor [Geomonas limicola]
MSGTKESSARCCKILALGKMLPGIAALVLGLSTPVQATDGGNMSEFLSMPLEDLMQIEITSVSKKSQRLSDAAAAVFVITQEDIRRSGVTSIPEALRMAPGVQVARIDANKWAVSIRGLNGRFANKLLVLMDGRSLYSPLFAGVYWEMHDTPLEDIERIEVIRGPGAALWGANAVNGVINIITKSSEGTQGGLVSAGGGTEARDFVTARYGFGFGKDAHARFFVRHQDTASQVYGDGTTSHDAWQMTRTGFRLDAQPSSSDTLTVSGDYFDGSAEERYTLYRVPTLQDPGFSSDQNATSKMRGGNLLGRWQRTLSDTSNVSLQLYYDHLERNMIILGERQDTLDLDFQHRFTLWNRQDIIWGLGFRFSNDALAQSAIISFNPPTRSTELYSAFLHDEIKLVPDRLSLIVGSRFEHNSYTGFEVQPNGRLLWTPATNHTFWGAVSRAVRTPARGDSDIVYRYLVDPTPQLPVRYEIDGNKSFKSENLTAYELGYRTEPVQHVALDVALFYNDYRKLRVLKVDPWQFEPSAQAPTDIVQPLSLANLMHGHTYGVEVAAEWSPIIWWRLHATYSYLVSKMYLENPSIDEINKRDAEGDSPAHQFTVRSGVDLGKGVEFDLLLRGTDKLSYIDRLSIPGYLTLDARLAWRPIPKLELSVVGQNLLHERKQEFNPEFINTFPTEVQRSVYGKVTWKF